MGSIDWTKTTGGPSPHAYYLSEGDSVLGIVAQMRQDKKSRNGIEPSIWALAGDESIAAIIPPKATFVTPLRKFCKPGIIRFWAINYLNLGVLRDGWKSEHMRVCVSRFMRAHAKTKSSLILILKPAFRSSPASTSKNAPAASRDAGTARMDLLALRRKKPDEFYSNIKKCPRGDLNPGHRLFALHSIRALNALPQARILSKLYYEGVNAKNILCL